MPNKRSTVPRECETCAAPFNARADHVKIGGGRFCSVPCIRRAPLPTGEALSDGAVRIPLRSADGATVAHTIVDAVDADWVNRWRWQLNGGYAARTTSEGGPKRQLRLHRLLLGLTEGDGREGDHIDRDRLNNRRSNLRVLLVGRNSQNQPGRPGTSVHRGVSWRARARCWVAYVVVRGKQHYLGQFNSEEEAAAAARAGRAQLMTAATD